MGLLAEFDIPCERLPLVSVESAVPDATLVVTLQYNHGNRPLFLLTATGGSQDRLEQALTDAVDVGGGPVSAPLARAVATRYRRR